MASTNASCIAKLEGFQMLTDSADQDWPRKSTITDLTISHLDNRFTEKSGQSDMWFTMFRRFHPAVLHSCFLIFSHDLRNFPTRYRDEGTPQFMHFWEFSILNHPAIGAPNLPSSGASLASAHPGFRHRCHCSKAIGRQRRVDLVQAPRGEGPP